MYPAHLITKMAVCALHGGISAVQGALWISRSIPFVLLYNGVADLAYVAIIVGIVNANTVISRIFAIPFAVLPGDSSYSVYILQNPIERWCLPVASDLGLVPQAGHLVRTVTLFVTCAVVLIGLSILSFMFLETPARHGILAAFDARRNRRQQASDPFIESVSDVPFNNRRIAPLVSETHLQ